MLKNAANTIVEVKALSVLTIEEGGEGGGQQGKKVVPRVATSYTAAAKK